MGSQGDSWLSNPSRNQSLLNSTRVLLSCDLSVKTICLVVSAPDPTLRDVQPDPAYSEEAGVANVSASATLQPVIDKSVGFGLDECAMASVSKWRFKPGMKDDTRFPSSRP